MAFRKAIGASLLVHGALFAWLSARQPSVSPQTSTTEPRIAFRLELPQNPEARPALPEPVHPEPRSRENSRPNEIGQSRARAHTDDPSPPTPAQNTHPNSPIVTENDDTRVRPPMPKVGSGRKQGSVLVDKSPDLLPRPLAPTAIELLPPTMTATVTPTLLARGSGAKVEDSQFDMYVARDGSLDFDDHSAISPPRIVFDEDGTPHVVFSLDLNDVILRALGDDPYAYDKRTLAARTQPTRDRMAREACQEDLSQALVSMKAELTRIWSSPKSAESKRSLFFQMWDQCAETGTPEVQQTAEQIRRTILAFIREQLPASSPLAYRPEEVERLNETRTSKRRFDPYGID